MSYLGKVALKASDIRRLDVTSSTSATHTLTWTPPNEQSLIITINGVKQQNNYSISCVTLTLDSALVATDEMEVIGINDIGTTNVPGSGVITNDMLSSSFEVVTAEIADDAVTADKLANSINTEIAANTAKVTNATHTGDVTGATALTIANDAVDIAMLSATGTADATTFLRGDNAWASAGGDNTPSFSVTIAASQNFSDSTWTKVEWDTEVWDTDSAFDSTTNHRFTVPAGEGGKYVFQYGAGFDNVDDSEYFEMQLYKNGSDITRSRFRSWSPASQKPIFQNGSYVMELAATDYVEAWCRHVEGGTIPIEVGYSYFAGYKLIGV